MLKDNLRKETRLPKASGKTRLLRRAPPMPWSYFVLGVVGCAAVVGMAVWNSGTSEAWQKPANKVKATDIPFGGERAYQVLKELCAIGPRVAGSEGMRRQQAMLKAHFEKLGGRATLQEFSARHPLD